MDKISELMDGELPPRESKRQIERLERDAQLNAGWNTYHLIGDALRREFEQRQDFDLRPDFALRLQQRLEREPTVIAPHTRFTHKVTRYTLPMAAGVAGVSLVAWLAMSVPGPGGGVPQPAKAPAVALPAPAAAMNDYMLAHQEFSPSTAMQGVASYVRTVSASEADSAR